MATPAVSTARENYATNLGAINGTGSYTFKATVRQGAVSPQAVLGLGIGEAAVYVVRTEMNAVDRYSHAERRRMNVTFVVRGYVYDRDGHQGQIEKLEHDIWRATVSGGALAANMDMPYAESVEFGEEYFPASNESDDEVSRGYVEIRLTCGLSETL